tara:strand:- start:4361 stop:4654 length:294 start_codon:yes stop_codon:yes gene_type:complete
MGEADKYFQYMLGYERLKFTFLSGFWGIIAFIMTLMYLSQVYHKYFDVHEEKDTDVELLNLKYTLILIALWVFSIVFFYLRNNRTFQKYVLLFDIIR